MKAITGTVVSTKMQKTVVVSVESKWQHPLYKKTVKRTRKFVAHDEKGAQEGQTVSIVQSRPISKNKRWVVTEILKDQTHN